MRYANNLDVVRALEIAVEISDIIDELQFLKITLNNDSGKSLHIPQRHLKTRYELLIIITQHLSKILQDLGINNCEVRQDFSKTMPDDSMKNWGDLPLIYECKNVYEEVDCVVDILKENEDLKICLAAVDQVFITCLTEKMCVSFACEAPEGIEHKNFLEERKVAKIIEMYTKQSALHFEHFSIIHPKDVCKYNADLFVFCNFTDKQYQAPMWLPDSIRGQLGLRTTKDINNLYENNFYYALGSSKVIVTLPQNTNENKILSKFEMRCKINNVRLQRCLYEKETDNCDHFYQNYPNPDVRCRNIEFSAHDVEMIMGDPFSFYIKRCLNIQPEQYALSKKQGVYTYCQQIISDFINDRHHFACQNVDYYSLQKCKSIANWLKTNQLIREKDAQINILGSCDFNIDSKNAVRLRAIADLIYKDTLVVFNTLGAKKFSANDLINGCTCAPMVACVIAKNSGFFNQKIDINRIEVWDMGGVGEEAVHVKLIEISNEAVEYFEQRLRKVFLHYIFNQSEFTADVENSYRKYRHYERIEK